MAVNRLEVLAPNSMGYLTANSGLEGMLANRGYGVAELKTKTNPEAESDQYKTSNPAVDKLRTQKAREFGMTKKQLGF